MADIVMAYIVMAYIITAYVGICHLEVPLGFKLCRVCRPGDNVYAHTRVSITKKLCGSAPYPALTQIDAIEKAAAVGWLSWCVHNIAIIMYDIE